MASGLTLASLAAGAGQPAAALGATAPAAAAIAAACRAPANGARPGQDGSPPAAVIRVDQVGYPNTAAKLAAVMTHSHRGGLRWALISRRGCHVVALGIARQRPRIVEPRVPGRVGDPVQRRGHRPGTYRLAVTGGARAVSPWFRIAPASELYARPLANALSFYQNERDGPDFIRSALRTAPGHLNDARAMTYRAPKVNQNGNFKGSLRPYATGLRINATGGWFDAGDYLKFTETTSYTVAMMLQGIASFPGTLGGRAVSFTCRGQVRRGILAKNVE